MGHTPIPRVDLPSPVKRVLPKSLFSRALLILVLPTILIQLLATYFFYERHWENVSRWMASSLAGEIALLVHELNDAPPARQAKLIALSKKLMDVHIRLEPEPEAEAEKFLRSGAEVAPIFYRELETRLSMPFALQLLNAEQDIQIRVKLNNAVLFIEVTRKRLVSATTYIFVLWLFGTTILLLGVAVIFLRNQIRPITSLAGAMDAFGRGQETHSFRPQGAIEVRRAGRVFVSMKQRLERQISARMEMLAGISHDLRTPLTRMKLEVEMLEGKADKASIDEIRRDISDMEHMIAEYLDFARGEGTEEPQPVDLHSWITGLAGRYQSQKAPVVLQGGNEMDALEVNLRPQAMRRAMVNLIDNALRYGQRCDISLQLRHQHVEVVLDDAGPGIPVEKREEVFQPFTRLDVSRNQQTGGVGLGLSITRDIILAHGGDITLQDAPSGGLRVVVRLPLG